MGENIERRAIGASAVGGQGVGGYLQLVSSFNERFQVLARIFYYLPNQITDDQWRDLVALPSPKERFEYVQFLRVRETKRNREEINRARKQSEKYESADGDSEEADENQEGDTETAGNEDARMDITKPGLHLLHRGIGTFQFVSCLRNSELGMMSREREAMKMYHAITTMDETPKAVVDCRFLGRHSARGLNLTLLQLNLLISKNRQRESPWPLHFANFDWADENVRTKADK